MNDSYNKLLIQKETLNRTLQELEKTKEQLVQSEKMAAMGVLVAGVAHEINNPLNFIKSGVSIIQSIKSKDFLIQKDFDEIDEVCQNVDVGVDRIAKIVKSLNSFSRKEKAELVSCNISEVLDSSLTLLKHEIDEKISVVKKYSETPIFITIDEGKLYQVFTNLINNGIQAMPKGGTLTLTTERQNDFAIIKVEDTGEGISEENLKSIYDPFFTTKDPGKGVGLGLSITFSIIEYFKGKIEFDSALGEGTTVTVQLPIA